MLWLSIWAGIELLCLLLRLQGTSLVCSQEPPSGSSDASRGVLVSRVVQVRLHTACWSEEQQ